MMKRVCSNFLFVSCLAWLSVGMAACGGAEKTPAQEKPSETAGPAEAAPAVPTAAALPEGELTGEITVSCYDAMLYEKFLDEAARLFEAQYPGTKVNISTFGKAPEVKVTTTEDGNSVAVTEGRDESQEQQDYISRINTELMSGRGPDVLAMDILPYYKYAESGLLVDLGGYMSADPDFDRGAYKANILDGVRYRGGQYIIPLDFGFEFISFDQTKAAAAGSALAATGRFSYDELVAQAEGSFSRENGRLIDFQGPSNAFRYQFRMEYKKYIDIENKKAHFTDSDFAALLEKIKTHAERGYYTPEFATTEESTQDFIDSQKSYYFKNQIAMVLQWIFMPREPADGGAFAPPAEDEVAGMLVNNDGDAVYRYYQAYGINANAANKRLAWEFVKFMLSEEQQLSMNLLGNPVNSAAFVEKSKIYLLTMPNWQEDGSVDGYTEMTDEKYQIAYDKYFERLTPFVDTLRYYPIDDKIINGMVYSEAELFFKGTKTAAEVASTLQNKVQLYLDE